MTLRFSPQTRRVFHLSLPIFAELLLQLLVGNVDQFMISPFGTAAVSAIGNGNQVMNVVIIVLETMSAATTILLTQHIGAGKKGEACDEIATVGVAVSGFFSLLMGLILLLAPHVIFTLLRTPAEAFDGACLYTRIVGGAVVLQGLYIELCAVLRSYTLLREVVCVSVVMNLMNVAGNAILIFGLGFDVAGVAIPTLVSRTVAAVVIVWLLFNEKLELHLSDIRAFRFEKRVMRNIFRIAIPSGVENGMFHFGRLILFSLISTFGTASITANAIGNTMGNFHVFAGQAICMGLTTVVSQCVGAGAYDRARYYMKKQTVATYAVMAFINITLILCIPLILRVYDVAPEAAVLAREVMLIHGGSAILLWLPSFMIPYFLRAAGDATYTMVVSMLTMWLVRVLGAYVIGRYLGYGVVGVWFAHAILDWATRSVIFYARYRSGKWERMAIRS